MVLVPLYISMVADVNQCQSDFASRQVTRKAYDGVAWRGVVWRGRVRGEVRFGVSFLPPPTLCTQKTKWLEEPYNMVKINHL